MNAYDWTGRVVTRMEERRGGSKRNARHSGHCD